MDTRKFRKPTILKEHQFLRMFEGYDSPPRYDPAEELALLERWNRLNLGMTPRQFRLSARGCHKCVPARPNRNWRKRRKIAS